MQLMIKKQYPLQKYSGKKLKIKIKIDKKCKFVDDPREICERTWEEIWEMIIVIFRLFVELIENTRKYIFSLTHNSGDPASNT